METEYHMFCASVKEDAESFDIRKLKAFQSFKAYKAEFIAEVSARFLSYLWYASWGEARNAKYHMVGEIPDCITLGCTRSTSAMEATEFNPEDNWQDLVSVFSDNKWDSAFGGDKWAEILSSFQYYYDYPTMRGIFIDLVVDLEHNGGCVFDKEVAGRESGIGLDIYGSDLHALLNYKKEYSLFLCKNPWVSNVSERTQDICHEVLYACGLHPEYVHPAVKSTITGYRPIWGEDKIKYYDYIDCCSCESCKWCGSVIACNHVYYNEGGYAYCENCYIDLYSHCEKCNGEISNNGAVYLDGSTYCEYCAKKVGNMCWKCDEWYLYDDLIEVNYDLYCPDCLAEEFTLCSECEEYIDNDDIIDVDGKLFCKDCISQCEICSTPCTSKVFEHAGIRYVCDECENEYKSKGFIEGQLVLPLFDGILS
jgi:hypothetical protein